jgi:hypothetical protein
MCGKVETVQRGVGSIAFDTIILPYFDVVRWYMVCETWFCVSNRLVYFHIISTLANVLAGDAKVGVASTKANKLCPVTASILWYFSIGNLSMDDDRKDDNTRDPSVYDTKST